MAFLGFSGSFFYLAIFFSHAFPQHLLFLSLNSLNVLSLVTSPSLFLSSDSNFRFSFLLSPPLFFLHSSGHFHKHLHLSCAKQMIVLRGKAPMLSQASISPGPHLVGLHICICWFSVVLCGKHYFFSFCLALEHISCFRSTPAPCH